MQLQDQGPCVVRQIRVLQHKYASELRLQGSCLDALCNTAAGRKGHQMAMQLQHRIASVDSGVPPGNGQMCVVWVTGQSQEFPEHPLSCRARHCLRMLYIMWRGPACHITANSTSAME